MLGSTVAKRALARAVAEGRRSISSLAVVGGGQMGTGIAYVTAVHAKKKAVVCDINQSQLDAVSRPRH